MECSAGLLSNSSNEQNTEAATRTEEGEEPGGGKPPSAPLCQTAIGAPLRQAGIGSLARISLHCVGAVQPSGMRSVGSCLGISS